MIVRHIYFVVSCWSNKKMFGASYGILANSGNGVEEFAINRKKQQRMSKIFKSRQKNKLEKI